jgi:SAM-dependent methyltransferase
MHLLQGLDLSPYFLAVAQFKEKKRSPRENPISWIHAIGEDTGLSSNSFDIVSMAYVVCVVVFLVFNSSFKKCVLVLMKYEHILFLWLTENVQHKTIVYQCNLMLGDKAVMKFLPRVHSYT